jgi:DNA recombination protein RmuC
MVDAVVKFPKFKLPIDSKFNREAILPLFETNEPAKLADARAQLATAIKTQARSIAEKYIHPEHGTTDLALMFLPSETLYFEVIRDGELLAAIHKLKVFPVSPNTLVIALRSIEMSLSHYEQAKGVEKTLEQIRLAQRHFGNFQKKFEDVGDGLERAQKAYAVATNHLARFEKSTVQLTGETPPEIGEPGTPPAAGAA